MKNLFLFFLLCIVVSDVLAQAVVPPNIRAANTLDRLVDLDGLGMADMLYGIPLPEGKVVGDTYLDTHWKYSTILLYDKDKMIEGYPTRYDIYLDELEVKGKNGVKVLKGNNVKSFVWIDSLSRMPSFFVNGKEYKNEENVPYTGFFEVLTEGTLPLFKRTFIDIKKADYNIQFNVGSHDDKIIKKNEFYMLKDNHVIALPSSKKKLVLVFDDKSEAIEKYIKDNNLASHKGEHLKLIFEYYNSLVNN
ncbi:hypothetical protein [Chryseolinea sp. H1M3-3]|uniref:hypothetical protein n=1 Tax=Chryseolinea sp. H1M3-3 TaxID=3034144 RepID=UPI0023EDC22C|nr:hypothetical protein [Chryseolinea sp. H1M3-3]